jgi:hypothetical protein
MIMSISNTVTKQCQRALRRVLPMLSQKSDWPAGPWAGLRKLLVPGKLDWVSTDHSSELVNNSLSAEGMGCPRVFLMRTHDIARELH